MLATCAEGEVRVEVGYTSCWPWFVFVVIPVVLLFGWKGWEWLETIEAVF